MKNNFVKMILNDYSECEIHDNVGIYLKTYSCISLLIYQVIPNSFSEISTSSQEEDIQTDNNRVYNDISMNFSVNVEVDQFEKFNDMYSLSSKCNT